MKIYIRAVLRLLLWLVISSFLFFAVESLIRMLYSELHMQFGDRFPTYSPITDKEKYIELENKLSLYASIAVFIILSIIATVFDNERYEHMIKETDGLYTVKNGIRIYSKRYALSDIVASLVAILPFFLLALIRFPKTNARFLLAFEEWLTGFLVCHLSFINNFGFVCGYLIAAAIIFTAKIPSAIIGLRRWRGLWLSDIEN